VSGPAARGPAASDAVEGDARAAAAVETGAAETEVAQAEPLGTPPAEAQSSGEMAAAREWLAAASIATGVMGLCPEYGYAAILMTADGLAPGPSDPASDALLAAAEGRAAGRLAGRAPAELPEVGAWRDAYRAFGAKPQRTRPSVEALLRRLDAGLPRIDRITDAYNAVSVARLLPVGGEDRAAYRGPARLVRASGKEVFDTMENGLPAVEHPDPGEVVWCDDMGVTCRRWNWRQCVRTRITTASTSAVFILDGLGPGIAGLHAAAGELQETLTALSPAARFARRLISPPRPVR
jgi:DNA/RNA-binding domain of Phe-tRNA-synthetase-like protein